MIHKNTRDVSLHTGTSTFSSQVHRTSGSTRGGGGGGLLYILLACVPALCKGTGFLSVVWRVVEVGCGVGIAGGAALVCK